MEILNINGYFRGSNVNMRWQICDCSATADGLMTVGGGSRSPQVESKAL